MQKKKFIGIAVIAIAALAAVPVSAKAQVHETENTEEAIAVQADGTEVILAVEETTSDTPESAEAATRELDRKAKQQEKARNAAENDSWGGAITLIAMGIVIMALTILSILFLCFGKVSTYLQKSRKRKAHGVGAHNAEEHHDELDSGEAIAAISMALAEHMGQGHDIEDTILTIRRMRKAYSPWNSKIYNLRVVPEHNEARVSRSLKK